MVGLRWSLPNMRRGCCDPRQRSPRVAGDLSTEAGDVGHLCDGSPVSGKVDFECLLGAMLELLGMQGCDMKAFEANRMKDCGIRIESWHNLGHKYIWTIYFAGEATGAALKGGGSLRQG